MGTYPLHVTKNYIFAAPRGNVSGYSWCADSIDMKIFRTIGAWSSEEMKTAELQSKILEMVSPSITDHWFDLNHKTFWEWVDSYELHT